MYNMVKKEWLKLKRKWEFRWRSENEQLVLLSEETLSFFQLNPHIQKRGRFAVLGGKGNKVRKMRREGWGKAPPPPPGVEGKWGQGMGCEGGGRGSQKPLLETVCGKLAG
jgi:hypothetical protein